MIEIPSEQLICRCTTHRDAVSVRGNTLHQQPMGKVGNGIYRRVVLAYENTQLREESISTDRNRRMTDTELGDGVLYHFLFFVSCVSVRDRKTVNVILTHILGNANE